MRPLPDVDPPGSGPGEEGRGQRSVEYDTLSDKEKRARYDQFGFNDPGNFGNGDGAGGFPAQLPSGAGPLTGASEVALSGGAGYAVYEVADANPAKMETAQFPTFIGISNVTAAAVAQESISFAPIAAPFIPRFVPNPSPPSDCSPGT